jgi:hypothetical protein
MLRTTLSTIIFASFAAISLAQAPSEISFQGYLEDDLGNPVTGSRKLVFALYHRGTKVWSETQSVTATEGLFNVALGSAIPLDSLKFGRPLQLGISVDKDPEMTPRTPLFSAAYARALPGLYTFHYEGEANVVGGSDHNIVPPWSKWATIGGGGSESAPNESHSGSTVSGGLGNAALGTHSTIGGGQGNTANTRHSTIGGGENNVTSAPGTTTPEYETIGGGESNTTSMGHTVISGGGFNTASGTYATIGGGLNNTASGYGSTIGGGKNNVAAGTYATIPGGAENEANAYHTLAAGFRAKANHGGTFVWADSISSIGVDFNSTGINQFLIRASGGVGIGSNSPQAQLHVYDTPSEVNGGNLAAYVALMENGSAGTSADGMAIKIGTTGNPGSTSNFIGFFDGDNDLIGEIEGNSSGGVTLNTTGADYAEWLPLLDPSETIEAGDVVGVHIGRISLSTARHDQLMVVTDRPAVLGNKPSNEETSDGFLPVSFVGQVPVKVIGPVESGDFLIPSGLDDGSAVALSPASLLPDQVDLVFATAWASNRRAGIKKVNAVVGVDALTVAETAIRALHEKTETLESRMTALEDRMDRLDSSNSTSLGFGP